MTKQAKHIQPNEGSQLNIMACEWGGYLVTHRHPDGFCQSDQAAFSSADECADWIRSFLRNDAAKRFGAKAKIVR